MNTAKLTISNPIEQIKHQNMFVSIESDEQRFIDIDIILFEDEEIPVDVNLNVWLENHPEGRSVKKINVIYLNAYDNRECEDLILNDLEKRELANYLKENLKIQIQ